METYDEWKAKSEAEHQAACERERWWPLGWAVVATAIAAAVAHREAPWFVFVIIASVAALVGKALAYSSGKERLRSRGEWPGK